VESFKEQMNALDRQNKDLSAKVKEAMEKKGSYFSSGKKGKELSSDALLLEAKQAMTDKERLVFFWFSYIYHIDF